MSGISPLIRGRPQVKHLFTWLHFMSLGRTGRRTASTHRWRELLYSSIFTGNDRSGFRFLCFLHCNDEAAVQQPGFSYLSDRNRVFSAAGRCRFSLHTEGSGIKKPGRSRVYRVQEESVILCFACAFREADILHHVTDILRYRSCHVGYQHCGYIVQQGTEGTEGLR